MSTIIPTPEPEGQGHLPHVARGSSSIEWYTPAWIIQGVKAVMGGISLDPASCAQAQRTIQAANYYTAKTNGLDKEWSGRVFLNPPYRRGVVDQFADKWMIEWLCGNIDEGMVLVNNATETVWFQTLSLGCSATCTLRGRIKFDLPLPSKTKAKGLQGQVLLYYGHQADLFHRVWRPYGQIWYPGVLYQRDADDKVMRRLQALMKLH